MVRDFSADGKQLVTVLGDKIEEARKAIVDIDARASVRGVRKHRRRPSALDELARSTHRRCI